jgi:hypothetical protein
LEVRDVCGNDVFRAEMKFLLSYVGLNAYSFTFTYSCSDLRKNYEM